MNLYIDLTNDNTENKENVGANLFLEIELDSTWEEIRKHNRICVQSYVILPVIAEGRERNLKVSMRDYYSIANIDFTKNPIMVTQTGFFEGDCIDETKVQVDCIIWKYDITDKSGERI